MKVTFHIPGALREFTNGRSQVEVECSGGSVADALFALWIAYPGVRDRMVNEQDQVRQHINVFVGNENIRYTGGLATPVPDGAFISIVPAVSGGSPAKREEALSGRRYTPFGPLSRTVCPSA